MLLVLALIIALLAIGGGIAINPLIFILLVVAVVLAFTHTRSGAGV